MQLESQETGHLFDVTLRFNTHEVRDETFIAGSSFLMTFASHMAQTTDHFEARAYSVGKTAKCVPGNLLHSNIYDTYESALECL